MLQRRHMRRRGGVQRQLYLRVSEQVHGRQLRDWCEYSCFASRSLRLTSTGGRLHIAVKRPQRIWVSERWHLRGAEQHIVHVQLHVCHVHRRQLRDRCAHATDMLGVSVAELAPAVAKPPVVVYQNSTSITLGFPSAWPANVQSAVLQARKTVTAPNFRSHCTRCCRF